MATTTPANGKNKDSKTATPAAPQGADVRHIPLDLIDADQDTNSRTSYDPDKEKELQNSMKNQGQLQAVEVEDTGNGRYSLVFGFRRYRAAVALGMVGLDARVRPKMEPWRRLVINGAENLAREDLSTYDQANMFDKLQKSYEFSGVKIGSMLGKSTQHVNNLLRIIGGVTPTILQRWELECQPNFGIDPETKKVLPNVRKVCTMDWLGKLAANVPKAEQDVLLQKELGLIADDEDTGSGESNRNPAPPGTVAKRPSKKNLEDALEAATARLKEAKATKEKDTLDGIIKTLKFALGTNKSIPNVYTMPKDNAQAE